MVLFGLPIFTFRPTRNCPSSAFHAFSHRQLCIQLSLLITARMLDQQVRLPFWQEKTQVSLCSCWHIPLGLYERHEGVKPQPACSLCLSKFFQRLATLLLEN